MSVAKGRDTKGVHICQLVLPDKCLIPTPFFIKTHAHDHAPLLFYLMVLKNGILGAAAAAGAALLKEELTKSASKRFRAAADTAWDTVEDYARSSFSGFTSRRPVRYNGAFARFVKPRFRRRFRTPARRRRGLRGTVRRRGRKGRRGLYNRKSKKMRPFNRGALSLQRKLMTGGSLPYQTAVSLYYRATDRLTFNNASLHNSQRTFCLNNIKQVASPALALGSPFYTGWRYLDLWKTLYDKYLIIGSVMTASFVMPQLPMQLVSVDDVGTYPGFWYARVYYRRANQGNSMYVGHYMSQDSSSTNTERLWNNRREFQADPTVSYVMDGAPRNYKLGYTSGGTGVGGTTTMIPSASTSIEMDFRTRAVKLRVKFSLKRHIGTQNPLENMPFLHWDNGPNSATYPFLVHFGYIAFSPDGTISRHHALSRIADYNATIDLRAKAILRDPLIGPEGPIDPEAKAKRPIVFDDDSQVEINPLLHPNSLDLQNGNLDLSSEASQLGSDEELTESEDLEELDK